MCQGTEVEIALASHAPGRKTVFSRIREPLLLQICSPIASFVSKMSACKHLHEPLETFHRHRSASVPWHTVLFRQAYTDRPTAQAGTVGDL
jgi:hypothetical protein